MSNKTNFGDLSITELNKIKDESKTKLKEMRVEKVIGSNFNLSEYRETKKDIARINTIIREYELGIRKSKEEK